VRLPLHLTPVTNSARAASLSRRVVVFCSVLEFGPVPTSPTPLLQGAPVRLLHPVGRASPRPVVWSVLLLPA